MGDRAVILVKSNDSVAPCGVYVHWRGEDSVRMLADAIPRMRASDPSYSMARLIGHIHGRIEGNLGLGVIHSPKSLGPRALRNLSLGDAGVIVYDCGTGKIEYAAGYLAEPEEGIRKHYAPDSLPVPPQ